jgi:hypothetical protein
VNGDGTNDFFFETRFPNTAPGETGIIWQLSMNPLAASTNGLVSYAGMFQRYAFALQKGALVGPDNPNFSTQTLIVLGSKYSYGSAGVNYYGGFAAGGPNHSVHPGTFAFVGFRFAAADGMHYGWVRLSVNAGIIDFHTAAYESVPNAAIVSTTLDPLVPEPGTLALLALGAVGVIGVVAKRRPS